MKKISLFLGMIAFIAFMTSCETDTVVQGNQDLQTKSGEFNAESTYHSILNNTESGMAQFDALTNSQKQAVWVFKYAKFKNDNSLTGLQEEAVDELLSYVNNADFTESNETIENSLETTVRDRFTEVQSDFLLLTLENDSEDITLKGCFWCYDEIPGTRTPCTPSYNTDGEIIGYNFSMQTRQRRFWIGWRTVTQEGLTCSESDYLNGWN